MIMFLKMDSKGSKLHKCAICEICRELKNLQQAAAKMLLPLNKRY